VGFFFKKKVTIQLFIYLFPLLVKGGGFGELINYYMFINSISLSVIPIIFKPESSIFNAFWMPDQARHYDKKTFMDKLIIKSPFSKGGEPNSYK